MKKIPTLLRRDPDNMRYVLDEVTPGCEWVLAGEGVATRKYDGTCVMLDENGDWWARREVKKDKAPPPNWVEADYDEVTGKRVGWEPIEQSPFSKFWAEAASGVVLDYAEPGTYELCGPKINRNPEGYETHLLIPHSDAEELGPVFQTLTTIEEWKSVVSVHGHQGWEGIVWHHPDGRMAKLKVRDLQQGEQS